MEEKIETRAPSLEIGAVTQSSIDWKINLSNPFNTNYYISAGIATSPCSSGQSSQPSGVLDYVVAGSSPYPTTGWKKYNQNPFGTGYTTVYGFARTAASGKYYPAGAYTLYSDKTPPTGRLSLVDHTDGWTKNKTFTIKLAFSDADSRVTRVWLALCKPNTRTPVGPGYATTISDPTGSSISLTFNTPTSLSQYAIAGTVRDAYENITEVNYGNFTIGQDKNPPNVSSCSVFREAGSGNIGVSCSASDSELGLGYMQVKISQANPGNNPVWSKGTIIYFKQGSASHSFSTDSSGKKFVNGVTYRVAIDVVDANKNAVFLTRDIVYTIPAPSPWKWSDQARGAFTGKKAFNNLTAVEWNQFVESIKNIGTYVIGGEIDLSKAIGTQGGKFTATHFNTVKNVIGGMKPTGIDNVSPGNPVKGSYFLTLETKLNEALKSKQQDIYNSEIIETECKIVVLEKDCMGTYSFMENTLNIPT